MVVLFDDQSIFDSTAATEQGPAALLHPEEFLNPFMAQSIPVHTSPAADPLSEIAAIEPIFPVVHPFTEPTSPVAEIASPIAIGAFEYSNPHVVVSPGPVNLISLPDEKFLHGSIDADGGCLFSAISYALSESQSLSKAYRAFALKYISDNPSYFEEDIFMETKMTVPDYITYMTPHFRFGDQVMVLALCLSLEVSITLYQKGRSLIDVCTFAPRTGNITQHAELYLDLYGYHYDCVLSAPLADQVPSYQES